MAEISNITVRVNSVITDERYHEAMGAVRVANGHMYQLEAENAKLREELDSWHRLAAGIELPDYPVVQFQPKDLERENAKLRELVADMYEAMRCVSETWAEDVCADRMHELGIEVE